MATTSVSNTGLITVLPQASDPVFDSTKGRLVVKLAFNLDANVTAILNVDLQYISIESHSTRLW